jgi:hypothetical protein
VPRADARRFVVPDQPPEEQTVKLVHAFHDGDLASLRDAGLRAALAEVGVRRLQVNLDVGDPDVLRLHTAEPIRAVVSSWTDDGVRAEDVGDVLRQVGPTLLGWRVEERVPVAPPETPAGERADALANLAFLRRPAELSHDDWIAHWHGPHTDVAIRTQATFGYVQNVVVESLTPETPRVDGIVEELFPRAAMTDVHAFYGSGGDRAELDRRMTELMASVSAFGADRDLDLVPTDRYVYPLG